MNLFIMIVTKRGLNLVDVFSIQVEEEKEKITGNLQEKHLFFSESVNKET